MVEETVLPCDGTQLLLIETEASRCCITSPADACCLVAPDVVVVPPAPPPPAPPPVVVLIRFIFLFLILFSCSLIICFVSNLVGSVNISIGIENLERISI